MMEEMLDNITEVNPLNPFIYKVDFTHCMQDEDHHLRKVCLNIKVMKKLYKGRRQQRITTINDEYLLANFEFMTLGSRYNNSSNEINIYP